MTIRQETPSEFETLYAFVQTAFETAAVSDGTEPDFADRLRAGRGYIPDLALVAEEDGAIIGHIMLTRTPLKTADGVFDMLLLAPLSVALSHRSQGVGSALVKAACDKARALGYTAVFLVGDPAYYSRLGFVAASQFGIACVGDIPAQYVQACELVPGALQGKAGTVDIE